MRLIVRLLRPAMRGYAAGADLSKLLRVPRWLDAVLSHDWVAFWLHALIGWALNRLEASPTAAGLEWLKAAAHARSDEALERVVAGLTVTRERAQGQALGRRLGAAIVRQVTCTGRDVTMRQRQLRALERAGISIPATPD